MPGVERLVDACNGAAADAEACPEVRLDGCAAVDSEALTTPAP